MSDVFDVSAEPGDDLTLAVTTGQGDLGSAGPLTLISPATGPLLTLSVDELPVIYRLVPGQTYRSFVRYGADMRSGRVVNDTPDYTVTLTGVGALAVPVTPGPAGLGTAPPLAPGDGILAELGEVAVACEPGLPDTTDTGTGTGTDPGTGISAGPDGDLAVELTCGSTDVEGTTP